MQASIYSRAGNCAKSIAVCYTRLSRYLSGRVLWPLAGRSWQYLNRFFLMVVGVFSIVLTLPTLAEENSQRPGQPILDSLRAGGLVLYMRHAHATVGSDELSDNNYWKNCSQQRRLSQRGEIEANTVGAFIKAHSIPVSQVISSPLCRSKNTAQLLKLGKVEISNNLSDVKTWKAMGKAKADIVPAYRQMLSTAPMAGTNVVLVSHAQRGIFVAHPILDLIGMGTIAVFRPGDHGQFELIAIIRPDDWQYLGVAPIPS